MKAIFRNTADANFEHCAKTLLPICVAYIRNLRPGDEIEDQACINMLCIVAEVAEAFSIERYGKPLFRVPAGKAEEVL
jgi:hypothetical protein